MRLLLLMTFALFAHAVDVGQPAPSLARVTWLKAGPVDPTRGLTVVLFWATWSGPSRTAIPHLTKLAKQYAERVKFAGLSDEDKSIALPFIAAQGPEMEYPVGLLDGATHAAWMGARTSIPTAFVIAADGKVAWVGDPMELDPVLAGLVAGTWNPAQAQRIATLEEELQGLLQSHDEAFEVVLPRALAKSEEVLALEPAHLKVLGLRRGLAKHLGKPEIFHVVLKNLPTDQPPGRAAVLADFLLEESALAYRSPALAERLAVAASEAAPGDVELWILRAQAHAEAGRVTAAIKAQKKANALRDDAAGAAALATLEAMDLLRWDETDAE